MEDQTHLTLGKRSTSLALWGKKREIEKEGRRKKPTASHLSVKGQRPQEHWIGTTGNHRRRTRCPEPSFWLQSALPVTSVLRPGRQVYGAAQTIDTRVGNIVYLCPNPDSIIGEANVQNPSVQPENVAGLGIRLSTYTVHLLTFRPFTSGPPKIFC